MLRGFGLALATLLVSALPAAAQSPAGFSAPSSGAHRLVIGGGVAQLDGRPLESIPQGLDLRGIELDFQYEGPVAPVIEIDGEAFVVEGRRMVRFEDAEAVRRARARQAGGEEAREARAYGRIASVPAPATEEAYLASLSESDRALYEGLEAEHQMEAEAERLAVRARQATGGARTVAEEALRRHLVRMFDHKQEMRRMELSRMEEDLTALKQRLQKRDRMRDAVVQKRMEQLLGR
jgi:hypothetical protein